MTGTAKRAGGVTLPTAEWNALETKLTGYRAALNAYVDAVNSRNIDKLVMLFADDAVIEDP